MQGEEGCASARVRVDEGRAPSSPCLPSPIIPHFHPPLPPLRQGIGGDNSNSAIGTYYEGCITAGYSTDDADNQVLANVIAAGYKL